MNFESCGYRCHSFSWTFNLLESKPQSSCPIFTLLLRLMVNIRFSIYAKFWLHRNLHYSVTYTDIGEFQFCLVALCLKSWPTGIYSTAALVKLSSLQKFRWFFSFINIHEIWTEFERVHWATSAELSILWKFVAVSYYPSQTHRFSTRDFRQSIVIANLYPSYLEILSLLPYLVFGLQLVPGKVNADIQPSCIH